MQRAATWWYPWLVSILMIQILPAPQLVTFIASLYLGIGNWNGFATPFSREYETHILQKKLSIFMMCSRWVFCASTIILPQGPLQRSIQPLLRSCVTFAMITLDFYRSYNNFLQKVGLAPPVSIPKSLPSIVLYCTVFYNAILKVNYYIHNRCTSHGIDRWIEAQILIQFS